MMQVLHLHIDVWSYCYIKSHSTRMAKTNKKDAHTSESLPYAIPPFFLFVRVCVFITLSRRQ